MSIIENAAKAAKLTEEQVCVVLTAIRTPSDTMMDAGLYQASHDADWADVYSSWVDMIDAALND